MNMHPFVSQKVRVIIDPQAGLIIVDNQQTQHDLSHLDPSIRLLHWYPEGWGAIDRNDLPMLTTTDFDLVLPYIRMHEAFLHEAASRAAEEARKPLPLPPDAA